MDRTIMRDMIFRRRLGVLAGCAAAACWLAPLPGMSSGAESKPVRIVAKWTRFEESFQSTVGYVNPVQDVTLKAWFTSPLGETSVVEGFWDGDSIWRVRFAPSLPGRWTFRTACSDTNNSGLHQSAGEFLCSAAVGKNVFHEHGPVQVARDHRHLEHTDGTPFFWLADTAWSGAREATAKEWEVYAQARAYQRFTAVQWAVGPGVDNRREAPISSFGDRIAVNPEFFKRLDAKVEILSEAGLLSVIVPLAEMPPARETIPLPDDQVAVLVRYMAARWGADPVVWELAFEGGVPSDLALRWKRVGQLAFGGQTHAPVMVCAGNAFDALDGFRHEPWADIFSCRVFAQTNDTGLAKDLTGPLTSEWTNSPSRPFIPLLPFENAASPQVQKAFAAGEVRRAAYWAMLLGASAGVSYGGEGIEDWAPSLLPGGTKSEAATLPIWLNTLSLPAGQQVGYIAGWLGSIDFWRLRPHPETVVNQPGREKPRRYIASAASEEKDMVLVYVPGDRLVELGASSLPASATVNWLNPRTGEILPAAAAVSGTVCQYATPGPEDWLLVARGPGR